MTLRFDLLPTLFTSPSTTTSNTHPKLTHLVLHVPPPRHVQVQRHTSREQVCFRRSTALCHSEELEGNTNEETTQPSFLLSDGSTTVGHGPDVLHKFSRT